MNTPRIRDARPEDASAIRAIVGRVLNEFGFVLETGATDADLVDIAASYQTPGGAFRVVVDEGGAIVGCAGLYVLTPHEAEVRKMYLLPDARGRGLGQALLVDLVEHARSRRFRRVVLETASRMTAALRLYKRFGFVDADGLPHAERCDRKLVFELKPRVESAELRSEFGEIDIYLFDQILKGRFDLRRRVLDAGCGDGRNLIYFLQRGFACFGIDRDRGAVEHVRTVAAKLAPQLAADNFQVGALDNLPWDDASMDAVVCSAVLHFASDEEHFGSLVQEMWRVLAPDGLFFARLASTIGLERIIGGSAGRRVQLPDGTERFVVDEAMLLDWTDRLGGELLDPIKTTNVQQQRCMTTWVVRKPDTASRALT